MSTNNPLKTSKTIRQVLQLLVNIATAYDDNELDGDARRLHGVDHERVNSMDPATIELYAGRGGRELLTLQHCFDARNALRALIEHGTDVDKPFTVD